MNAMVTDLAALSSEVSDATDQMAQSSAAILGVVSEHTAATTEQAASIAGTSVTVDEVRATSEQASTRAEEVARQAQAGLAVADDGAAAVREIEDGMQVVRQRVEAIASGTDRLAERASAIGVIAQTVNDLADRSNMLALNATIEAARAGDQGKRSAVVADEVRKLAEQSKGAVSQVQDILGEIGVAVHAAESATVEGTQAAEDGVIRAQRAGQAITKMSDTMRQTAHAATAIAASVREQHVGMSQVGQAMRDVSTSTSQIAAGANDMQTALTSFAISANASPSWPVATSWMRWTRRPDVWSIPVPWAPFPRRTRCDRRFVLAPATNLAVPDRSGRLAERSTTVSPRGCRPPIGGCQSRQLAAVPPHHWPTLA
jgi:methyl-accepting chemotaxis protein